MTVNEFSTWFEGVPLVIAGGNAEFNVWNLLVPVADMDLGSLVPDNLRRRATEY